MLDHFIRMSISRYVEAAPVLVTYLGMFLAFRLLALFSLSATYQMKSTFLRHFLAWLPPYLV